MIPIAILPNPVDCKRPSYIASRHTGNTASLSASSDGGLIEDLQRGDVLDFSRCIANQSVLDLPSRTGSYLSQAASRLCDFDNVLEWHVVEGGFGSRF